MLKLSKEIKVGLLTIVSGTILYIGFNFLKGVELFSKTHQYYVVYDNIDGLQESNLVVLQGMPVGRVQSIDILQGKAIKMLVTLDIDASIRLTDSCVLVLKDAGLLGGKTIEILYNPKGRLLQHQDTIQGVFERGIASQATERAMPLIQQADTILFRVNNVLATFDKMSDTIQQIIKNVAVLTGNSASLIAENRKNLLSITNNLSALSKSLVETEKELKPLLIKMNHIADSVKAMQLGTMSEKIQQSLTSINQSLTAINEAQGTLGKLLKDSALYVNSNQTLKDLDSLLVDFRKHPKRYVHFSIFGRKEKK
ncbi:MAG: MlaD family protein [Cytophagales bacterium]|nr:MlaD family protein [Cytophagales bacterium]MDW8384595.1 MlaD family protein [Flammeovirgaceae bacterium]